MYETVSLTALNYIFKKAGRKKEKKKQIGENIYRRQQKSVK